MSKRFIWPEKAVLLSIVLTAIVLLVMLCDRMLWIDWVGHTDLKITFAVVDAETEEPIPSAILHVHSDGGLFEEREPKDFQLVTNAEGRVSRSCRHCLCGGQEGLLRNTFSICLPDWSIHASAPGYEQGEPVVLSGEEYGRRVERNRGGARLTVPIPLHKKLPKEKEASKGAKEVEGNQ